SVEGAQFYFRAGAANARGRGLAIDGLRAWKDGGASSADSSPLGDTLAIVSDAEFAYAATAITPQAAKLAEAAKVAMEAANSKEKPVTGDTLRRLLTEAAFLDTAVANVGQSDGSTAAQAIERLKGLHQDDVKAWGEKLPKIRGKLDLVLRDQSLEQALAA